MGVVRHKFWSSIWSLWEDLRAPVPVAPAYITRRWTEGPDGYPLVPYYFQDSINQDDIRAALDHWMEHTCIKFEEKTSSNINQPHLQFCIGPKGICNSYIGMVWWQHGQQVSIGEGCNGLGTVVHEVGHAIGFRHEHGRTDRDDYVTILYNNINPNLTWAFDKKAFNNFSVPYNYASIMHYGQNYYSFNGKPTIITKDPLAQELIGIWNQLTHRDKLKANRIYNCIGKWLTKCSISTDPCLNDGYTGKHCKCVCPSGTKGSNCEEIVDDYYAHLRNPLSEKVTIEKRITIDSTIKSGTSFTKWIVPPSCSLAKMTFTSANMYKGECEHQNLYVKTGFDDVIGQTLCAADITIGTTLTSDTVIFITMLNHYKPHYPPIILWEADVTFENIHGCSATDPSVKKHQITDLLTPQPPTTDPPTIKPPTTDLPKIQSSTTDLPPTQPPTTDPPTIQPPTTDLPKTQSSTTDPPPIQPPTTDSPKSQPPTRVAWGKMDRWGKTNLMMQILKFQLKKLNSDVLNKIM